MVGKKQRLARFPRLQVLREELGWSIHDLLSKVDFALSERSVRRLENGEAIRITSANKLFHAINESRHEAEKLIQSKEIVAIRTK